MFTHDKSSHSGKRISRTKNLDSSSVLSLSIDQSFTASTKKLKPSTSANSTDRVPSGLSHLIAHFDRVRSPREGTFSLLFCFPY